MTSGTVRAACSLIDGENFWTCSPLEFLHRPQVRDLLGRNPGAGPAFEMRCDIGI
ncbi:MAG: hypothetical protein OXI95_04005 [bacterium]|nr:hypothetical protein [bacterium]